MDLGLWKEKGELKKFIENLGIEYRYGCYEEKNPQVCHLLADYFLSIEKNFKKSAEIYENNCSERDFGLSCDAYGRMAIRGQGMDGPDKILAFKYFERGCSFNEPRSCYHAGQMLSINDKSINHLIKPDVDRGIQMLQKACVSGIQPTACLLAHSLLLVGVHDKEKDFNLAAKYGKIACHQNEYQACYNLARMYERGDGVEVDPDMHNYYKQRTKQCLKGTSSKFHVGKNTPSDD